MAQNWLSPHSVSGNTYNPAQEVWELFTHTPQLPKHDKCALINLLTSEKSSGCWYFVDSIVVLLPPSDQCSQFMFALLFFSLFIAARVTGLKLTATLQCTTRDRDAQKTNSKFILMTESAAKWHRDRAKGGEYRQWETGGKKKKKKEKTERKGGVVFEHVSVREAAGAFFCGLDWKSSLSAQRGNGG